MSKRRRVRTLHFLSLVAITLTATLAKAQTRTTCQMVEGFSQETRDGVYLGAMMGYVAGWAEAQLERDKVYPEWLFQHRYGVYVIELKVICENRPEWDLEDAMREAFVDVRFGRPFPED